MKRFIKTLLSVLLLLSLAVSMVACGGDSNNGATTQTGLKYKKDAKTGLYTIYGYNQVADQTVLDLGAIATEKNITFGKIATGAFSGNDMITKIIVPDTVTEIATGAFKNMNKLEELVLPFIGKTARSDAFLGEPHTAGENEDIAKSVDVERTFAYIFGTDSYEKGSPVTVNYGGGEATYYIPAYFTKVTIQTSKAYSIPMYAFSGISLVREVVLCDTIDAIGDNAFSNCHDLTSVNIPASVQNIYKEAFKDSVNFGLKLTSEDNANIALAKLGADVFAGTKLDK